MNVHIMSSPPKGVTFEQFLGRLKNVNNCALVEEFSEYFNKHLYLKRDAKKMREFLAKSEISASIEEYLFTGLANTTAVDGVDNLN